MDKEIKIILDLVADRKISPEGASILIEGYISRESERAPYWLPLPYEYVPYWRDGYHTYPFWSITTTSNEGITNS